MARWDTNEYQRIVAAEPRSSDLRVDFEDGTSAVVNYANVLPRSSTRPDWAQAQVGRYEIVVPTAEGAVEIPWSTIRVLTDPEYSTHIATAAQDEAKDIGQRIRSLRKVRGLSGRDLATRAGITPQSLSRIDNGHHDVVYTTLRRILAAMDFSLRDLTDAPIDPASEEERDSTNAANARRIVLDMDNSIDSGSRLHEDGC